MKRILAELRQKEQQRRVVEQEIAGLEKEALRLSQMLEHERAEIEKTGKQLDVEQEKMTAARTELQPDPQLAAAGRPCAGSAQRARSQRGSAPCWMVVGKACWRGRRSWPKESAPSFRNSAAILPDLRPAMSSAPAFAELDRQTSELDEKLKQLALQLKEAEAAEKELNSRAIRLQELDKQAAALEERRTKNRSGRPGWIRLQAAGRGSQAGRSPQELI